MKPFIKIGTLYLNVADIIAVDANFEQRKHDYMTDENISIFFVRIVTRELICDGPSESAVASESVEYRYQHGTPEATAILAWLEGQSQDLLRKAPVMDEQKIRERGMIFTSVLETLRSVKSDALALSIEQIAEETGLDEDQVRQAVSELDEVYKVGDLYTVFDY